MTPSILTRRRRQPPAPAVPPAPAEDPIQPPQGWWCWAAYLASLLVPSAGLALGIVYASRSGRAARRFGWACLALALAGWILWSLAGKFGNGLGLGDSDQYSENYY